MATWTDKPLPPYKLDEFADQCLNTVDSFLRAFLVRDNKLLPASYEAVYQACRTVVVSAGRGEALYSRLKQTLEKCVRDLSKELLAGNEKGVRWIVPFNEVCVWFERRVVSVSPQQSFSKSFT